MTPPEVGLIGIGVMLILLFSGIPIAFAMAIVGFVGFAYLQGWDNALFQIRTVPFSTFFMSYTMTCIPMFVLMGELAFHSGISEELYETVNDWLGHLPGGLAMATIGACSGFAAVCGSSTATAATMGSVALPEMRRYGYSKRLATATVAAGGTLGILIPPSVLMIIYGVMTETSISKLFIAGFIPGILQAGFYILTIYIICAQNPALGPRGPKTSWSKKISSLSATWPVIILFGTVMGGLYFGVFTPTEAGGAAAFASFCIALGRRKLTWKGLVSSLFSTVQIAAFLFFIVMGATLLSYFLAVTRLPDMLANFITQLGLNRYAMMAIIIAMYLVLGCFMEGLSIMLVTIPFFLPLILSLGYDLIWFGIIIVRIVEIGLITPPVGINVFVIKGVAKDTSMYTIFRGIIPFLISDIIHVSLLLFFPQIALMLTRLMM